MRPATDKCLLLVGVMLALQAPLPVTAFSIRHDTGKLPESCRRRRMEPSAIVLFCVLLHNRVSGCRMCLPEHNPDT